MEELESQILEFKVVAKLMWTINPCETQVLNTQVPAKYPKKLIIQEKMIHMVGMLFQIWWLGWGTKKAKAGNICYHLSSRKKIKVNHFISLVNLFWWYIKFNGGTCEWEVWTSLLFSAFCEPLRLKFHMDFLIKSAWNLSLRDSSSFIELEFQSLEMLVYKIV